MKYDYLDFFVNLIACFIGCVIGIFIEIYFMNMPVEIIIWDIPGMIWRSILISSIFNVFHNVKRIYRLLDRISEDGKNLQYEK